jgi:hypothetical protein
MRRIVPSRPALLLSLSIRDEASNRADRSVAAGTIVGLLAAEKPTADILAAYPYLEPDDISAALALRGVARRGSRTPPRAVKVLVDVNLSPAWTDVLADVRPLAALHPPCPPDRRVHPP